MFAVATNCLRFEMQRQRREPPWALVAVSRQLSCVSCVTHEALAMNRGDAGVWKGPVARGTLHVDVDCGLWTVYVAVTRSSSPLSTRP